MESDTSLCRNSDGRDIFPNGMRVLVVDDDPVCLMCLERMLRQCSYSVTTCGRATSALAILREKRDAFDLVISDVYMPDMDGFRLLELVGLELDLPVIMMSANGETSAVMKGITHGACDYLLKPVRIEELRNIWQHVVRRKTVPVKKLSLLEDEYSGSLGESDSLKKKNLDDKDLGSVCGDISRDSKFAGEGNSLANVRGNDKSDYNLKKRKEMKLEDDFDNDEDDRDNASGLKKTRVVWSVELHQQFVNSVNKLGVDKAVPKRILEIMGVQGLTRENVASHLQKYRLYLKRINAMSIENQGSNQNAPHHGQRMMNHVHQQQQMEMQRQQLEEFNNMLEKNGGLLSMQGALPVSQSPNLFRSQSQNEESQSIQQQSNQMQLLKDQEIHLKLQGLQEYERRLLSESRLPQNPTPTQSNLLSQSNDDSDIGILANHHNHNHHHHQQQQQHHHPLPYSILASTIHSIGNSNANPNLSSSLIPSQLMDSLSNPTHNKSVPLSLEALLSQSQSSNLSQQPNQSQTQTQTQNQTQTQTQTQNQSVGNLALLEQIHSNASAENAFFPRSNSGINNLQSFSMFGNGFDFSESLPSSTPSGTSNLNNSMNAAAGMKSMSVGFSTLNPENTNSNQPNSLLFQFLRSQSNNPNPNSNQSGFLNPMINPGLGSNNSQSSFSDDIGNQKVSAPFSEPMDELPNFKHFKNEESDTLDVMINSRKYREAIGSIVSSNSASNPRSDMRIDGIDILGDRNKQQHFASGLRIEVNNNSNNNNNNNNNPSSSPSFSSPPPSASSSSMPNDISGMLSGARNLSASNETTYATCNSDALNQRTGTVVNADSAVALVFNQNQATNASLDSSLSSYTLSLPHVQPLPNMATSFSSDRSINFMPNQTNAASGNTDSSFLPNPKDNLLSRSNDLATIRSSSIELSQSEMNNFVNNFMFKNNQNNKPVNNEMLLMSGANEGIGSIGHSDERERQAMDKINSDNLPSIHNYNDYRSLSQDDEIYNKYKASIERNLDGHDARISDDLLLSLLRQESGIHELN